MSRDSLKRETFMVIAEVLAGLGTCDRKMVGAVIVREGRCVSWGFNGAPPGAPHCSENDHGWKDSGQVQDLGSGCRNATHAEANALAFAAKEGISTANATLFVTVSPCDVCARLLIAAGIVGVYYREEYRDRSGIEVLHRAGISCRQLRA